MGREVSYKAVAGKLRDDILSGKLKPGQKLPGEHKLADEFEISRITARLAFQMLEEQSLVYRRRGSGTYVGACPEETADVATSMFSQNVARYATDFRRELIESKYSAAGDELASVGLTPGDKILWFRRLDWIGDKQLGFDEGWIAAAYADRLEADDLVEMCFWEHWQRVQGFCVSRSNLTLEAAEADASQAELLGLEPGKPLLLESSDVFAGERGVGRFRTWYRFDMYKFKKTFHFLQDSGDRS